MRVDKEAVRHVALLARIGVTEQDLDSFGSQMSRILDNFDLLEEVDTTGVEPTGHSSDLMSVSRSDVAQASPSKEEMMANVPLKESDFVRIKSVLG